MKIITTANKVDASVISINLLKKFSSENQNAYSKLLEQLGQLFPDIAFGLKSNKINIEEAKEKLQNMTTKASSYRKNIITANISSSIQKALAILTMMGGLVDTGYAGGPKNVKTIEQTFTEKTRNRNYSPQPKPPEQPQRVPEQKVKPEQKVDSQVLSGRQLILDILSKIPKDLISSGTMGGFNELLDRAYREGMRNKRNLKYSFSGCILKYDADGIPNKATLKKPIIIQGSDIQFEIKNIDFTYDPVFLENNMEKLIRLNLSLTNQPREVVLIGNLRGWGLDKIILSNSTFYFPKITNSTQESQSQTHPEQKVEEKNTKPAE